MAELTAKQMAQILDLSLARIGQLAKEGVLSKQANGRYLPSAVTQYVRWIRQTKSRGDSDGEKLDREYLIAKTEYTKNQNIKLKRQLALEAGTLMRAKYLDSILLTFLKHYDVQTDWIRRNRTGDQELLNAHLASVKGARRECHSRGYVEGKNLEAD